MPFFLLLLFSLILFLLPFSSQFLLLFPPCLFYLSICLFLGLPFGPIYLSGFFLRLIYIVPCVFFRLFPVFFLFFLPFSVLHLPLLFTIYGSPRIFIFCMALA